MNKKNFISAPKTLLFGLLAVSALSIIPSSAQADEAIIQETVQESYSTGKDNLSIQNSSQQNRQSTVYRDRYGSFDSNNTGIVQRTQQYCDQYGESNTCVQNSQQINSTRTHRSRH
ncbi:hypothetical protein STA3757_10450 [Stanieria sp. NIES-3757]|nr:hypothetical protein STA3757_10450 [Stanieria sp. NIES-3757]